MQKAKCTAIVLAAGQGKRMGTKVQKQYLEISGKPVLFYSLDAFQRSNIIDEIILVVGENQEEFDEKYSATKSEVEVQNILSVKLKTSPLMIRRNLLLLL